MSNSAMSVVILAAGKGTRMYSDLPKVLHTLAGKPMVQHVIDAANDLGACAVHLVYGHGGDLLRQTLHEDNLNWVLQAEQLGTGHAMQQAAPFFNDDEDILMLYGAYDSRQNAYADFSGRGSQFLPIRKPDLAAPGVSISAPVPGGGYATVTGTSFAAPFVSGSAALLMEWGIVKGNDPFLYGEKVKAYLRKGAQSVGGYEEYPNVEVGWGRLCLAESIPYGIS